MRGSRCPFQYAVADRSRREDQGSNRAELPERVMYPRSAPLLGRFRLQIAFAALCKPTVRLLGFQVSGNAVIRPLALRMDVSISRPHATEDANGVGRLAGTK